MPKKSSKRLFAGVRLILGVMAFLNCVVGIIGAWVVGEAVSNSLRGLLTGIEKSTVALRSNIEMAGNRVASLTKSVNAVKSSMNEMDQNVKGEDLAAFLPQEAQDLQMLATAHSIRDISSNIRETISGPHETVRAVNRLPFVQLDIPGQDVPVRLHRQSDQLFDAVSRLKEALGEIRVSPRRWPMSPLSLRR